MHAPDSTPLEHWHIDASDAGVALLDIPPDAQRERRFELFCSLSVQGLGEGAWQQLQVLVNGSQEWLRREDTHASGRDSLDYRFRRIVPPGQPLRVTASSEVHRARRLRLCITADED